MFGSLTDIGCLVIVGSLIYFGGLTRNGLISNRYFLGIVHNPQLRFSVRRMHG